MRQASEGNTIYRIGLDARPLSTRVSGVGRLIAETIRHFPEKEKYKFVLFSHLPIHESHKTILELPNVEFHQGKGFLSKKGATYFNISLPLSLNQFHLDLFWGSQQVIPHLLFSKLLKMYPIWLFTTLTQFTF